MCLEELELLLACGSSCDNLHDSLQLGIRACSGGKHVYNGIGRGGGWSRLSRWKPSVVGFGVRRSIIDRMQRHGGTGEVRSTSGEGTEVRLHLPRPRTGGEG